MRVAELIRFAAGELGRAGIAEADSEVLGLLGYCLGKTRTGLYLAAEEEVPEAVRLAFLELLARRRQREPLAYILGEREFWSLPFFVSPAVLIPRPETEFLLEQVLAACRKRSLPAGRFLDLCCGSGVIAIVLALELGREVTAVDLSGEALAVAGKNCRRHGVGERVSLILADLLSAFAAKRMFSLAVSNPPYVSSGDIRGNLEPEVAEHEPRLALDGGDKGLDVIERIRDGLPAVMLPGGEVFIEIGAEQGQAASRLFSEPVNAVRSFQEVEILQDYAGRDRVLHARISV